MKQPFEELKQEFYKRVLMGEMPWGIFEEFLTALLEAWDASKWRKYPENVPEEGKSYLLEYMGNGAISINHTVGEYHNIKGWVKSILVEGCDVIVFRELPKPFNPDAE